MLYIVALNSSLSANWGMNTDTSPQNNFPGALKLARKACNVSQEAFGLVSSRTYVSSLERGIGQPTLNKVDELASVLGIEPLTLLALAYLHGEGPDAQEALMADVANELSQLLARPVTFKFT